MVLFYYYYIKTSREKFVAAGKYGVFFTLFFESLSTLAIITIKNYDKKYIFIARFVYS
jgi:hypothetical protein